MSHPIRLSIDMETPSSERTAGILTLGAVQFGHQIMPQFGPHFYAKASLASNERRGLTISRETMEWWDKQDPVMRTEVFSGTQDVEDLLNDFTSWCINTFDVDNLQNIELWSRGAGFDCEILQNAYLEIHGSYPFNFRKHMCQRTVQDLMPPELLAGIPKNDHKHHALHDAIYQANILEVALRNMRWA